MRVNRIPIFAAFSQSNRYNLKKNYLFVKYKFLSGTILNL